MPADRPRSPWLSALAGLGRSLRDGLVRLLFPPVCWVCDRLFEDARQRICRECAQRLTSDAHETCPRCAGPVGPFANLADGCPACKSESFAFDGATRLGPYDGLLRDVVVRQKNIRIESLVEIVGALWAESQGERFSRLEVQAAVPVPLHWTRRWSRGFNQSEVLARCLARKLCIPHYPRCLRRIRRTPMQSRLASPAERRENVRGAFAVGRGVDLAGKRILLVDDVMATGATAHEAARALRTLKPASIHLAVLAHGR